VSDQKLRGELARRLVFVEDALRGGVYIKSSLKWVELEQGHEPAIAPVASTWMSRCDLRDAKDASLADDAMIIYVPAGVPLPAQLPPGCERLMPNVGELKGAFLDKLKLLDEHAMQREISKLGLALGDFDAWATPHADAASGLRSFAHNTVYVSADFDYDADPITGHADWTDLNDGAYIKSVAANSRAENKYSAENRRCEVTYDLADMSAVTADYSVEANLHAGDAIYEDTEVLGRVSNSNAFYSVRLKAAALDLLKYPRTTLAQTGVGYTNPSVCRLEMAGTALKAYWDGTTLSVVDGTHSAAGSAGIGFSMNAATEGGLWINDYKVYVEGIARPKVGGSLAAGRVGLVR